MSLKNKLNRLKPHISRGNEEKPIFESKQINKDLEIPYLKEWKVERVSPSFFEGEYCLVREIRYPLDYQHGKYRFSDFCEAVKAWNDSSYDHPLSSKGFQPEELFFFDTETTGLGGGTGNTIFLLGHASIKGEEVVLKQHILPHPGAEVPLYKSFLENVDYTTLVTYNGRAFDWPQVKTRHTLIRDQVPKLPSFGHFDLYHAARRIWKHKLDRIKLSIVEKEVLGVERVDDIPGFLAPMIFFDFVETKKPEGMLGILKHNEIDILSLISLYTHLSFQLTGLDQNQTIKETFEVGRWYSTLGDTNSASEVFSQITSGNDFEALRAKHALAFEMKKQKQWERAAELWEEVAQSDKGLMGIEACVELAKFMEHKMKNVQSAWGYCEKAHTYFHDGVDKMGKKISKLEMELEKRLERLKAKMNKRLNG